jgi:hypothetical protein
MSLVRLSCVLLIVLICAGCAAAPKAWERGRLARPEMAWEPDPLTASYRDNVHFSKEAASGGANAGGGGCGCN